MTDSVPGAAFWDRIGWTPSTEQQQQLLALQGELRDWNQRVNLTRLLEGDDYWINQVFDSLWPLQSELKQPEQQRTAIDVGTGGGFRGWPWRSRCRKHTSPFWIPSDAKPLRWRPWQTASA